MFDCVLDCFMGVVAAGRNNLVAVKDPLLLQGMQSMLFWRVTDFRSFLLSETVQGLIPGLLQDGDSCRTSMGGGGGIWSLIVRSVPHAAEI